MFWLFVFSGQNRQLKIKGMVLSSHERAVRNCPWTMGLWKSYLQALERHGADHQTVSGNNQRPAERFRWLLRCWTCSCARVISQTQLLSLSSSQIFLKRRWKPVSFKQRIMWKFGRHTSTIWGDVWISAKVRADLCLNSSPEFPHCSLTQVGSFVFSESSKELEELRGAFSRSLDYMKQDVEESRWICIRRRRHLVVFLVEFMKYLSRHCRIWWKWRSFLYHNADLGEDRGKTCYYDNHFPKLSLCLTLRLIVLFLNLFRIVFN